MPDPLDARALELLSPQLAEAWNSNNRINLMLLENISEPGLRSTLSTRGGRDVARQFAHLHNVRIDHLEGRARVLAEGLAKFESKVSPSRKELVKAFKASGKRVEALLVGALAGKPKHRGFKKGIFTTLAYFVAHESHHRGNILLTLKQSGHKLDKSVEYGIWGWDQV